MLDEKEDSDSDSKQSVLPFVPLTTSSPSAKRSRSISPEFPALKEIILEATMPYIRTPEETDCMAYMNILKGAFPDMSDDILINAAKSHSLLNDAIDFLLTGKMIYTGCPKKNGCVYTNISQCKLFQFHSIFFLVTYKSLQ